MHQTFNEHWLVSGLSMEAKDALVKEIEQLALHPRGERFATLDAVGGVQLWSIEGGSMRRPAT